MGLELTGWNENLIRVTGQSALPERYTRYPVQLGLSLRLAGGSPRSTQKTVALVYR